MLSVGFGVVGTPVVVEHTASEPVLQVDVDTVTLEVLATLLLSPSETLVTVVDGLMVCEVMMELDGIATVPRSLAALEELDRENGTM